jgi:hypothetical protein
MNAAREVALAGMSCALKHLASVPQLLFPGAYSLTIYLEGPHCFAGAGRMIHYADNPRTAPYFFSCRILPNAAGVSQALLLVYEHAHSDQLRARFPLLLFLIGPKTLFPK